MVKWLSKRYCKIHMNGNGFLDVQGGQYDALSEGPRCSDLGLSGHGPGIDPVSDRVPAFPMDGALRVRRNFHVLFLAVDHT
jgi:hypothetical protein